MYLDSGLPKPWRECLVKNKWFIELLAFFAVKLQTENIAYYT